MNALVVHPLPELGVPVRPRKVRQSETVLSTGLRVIAIRKHGVPLVEIRLRVPLFGATRDQVARSTVLSDTTLKGTKTRDALEYEQAVGLLGATLDVDTDHDKVSVGGSVLRTNLPAYLDLLADALTGATYPTGEVDAERARLVERLRLANSQAGTGAAKARAAALYGDHPYGITLPEAGDLDAATAASVRSMHRRRVVPTGAVLVLVGDLQPAQALGLVEKHLAGWTGSAPAVRHPKLDPHPSGPLVLVDRPGSVQSAIRLGGVGLDRADPDYAAQQVANIIFGGNFSSRLVRNLREDKGYTYSPGAAVDPRQLATTFVINADVATDVTAASLVEIAYELGRMVTTLPSTDEVANARQYLIGSRSLALSTQAGLASMVANLEFAGLSLGWLYDHQVEVGQTEAADVRRAAERMMRPTAIRTAVVADAEQAEASLRLIADVVRAPATGQA